MGYWVGIDVGTTFTAAAVCREEVGRHALPEWSRWVLTPLR